jgi:Uma2 family endonuclease
MATTAIRLTVDDLELIPEERVGDRHELIDGELFVSPVPNDKHQAVSGNIVYALETFVRQRRLGWVRTAPSGVRLVDDTLVVPDASFLARDHADRRSEKGIVGPPDLIVEILSPGTRGRDLRLKRELYARFGAPEYWIVDPDAKTVSVLSLGEEGYEAVPPTEGGALVSHVLPGFMLEMDEVFGTDL